MLTISEKIHFDCDVLVSGAGPAGSAIAYHLAKMGLRVLVAESEKFPRDKVCGDAVSPIAINELHLMGITSSAIFKKANEITKVGLFVKNDHAIVDLVLPEELPYHARIIPRLALDNSIFENAKKQGAVVMEQTRVLSYTVFPNKVVTKLQSGQKPFELVSKILIGADGSRSIVRRILRNETFDDDFQLIGLRAYYDNVAGPRDRMDVYFTEENFPGIYWFFPEGESGANVGLATLSKTFPYKQQQVKKLLTDHIAQNKDIRERINGGSLRDKIEGWPITFYDAQKTVTGNRVMLVGEAAGLINPLSGDGIQYALLSARWASEILASCFSDDDFSAEKLYSYKKVLDEQLGYDLAFSNLIVHFPRNKSLLTVWMKAVETLVARAKEDQQFGEIIVGISEGTFPSFKALTFDFVLKILLQGGTMGSDYIMETLKKPSDFRTDGQRFFRTVQKIFSEMTHEPQNNLQWMSQIAKKLYYVSQHAVKARNVQRDK